MKQLKSKQKREAYIGFIATILVVYFKNSLQKKKTKFETVLISALGWSIHYIIRKTYV